MANLQVNLPDNQLQFFINLISKLGYHYTSLKEVDWYDELTEQQQKDIKTSRKQLAQGKGIPHDEVQKEVDKLLGRV